MATPDSIDAAGEAALVDRIRRRAGSPPGWLRVGIGDDAAVYEPDRGALQVITTDGLVEGVHFELDRVDAGSVGYKAVAVNLSDLAAMGAEPRGILLSLVLPATFTLADFDALIDGAVGAATEARAAIIGGNLARTHGGIVVDVTALGAVHPRKILTRAGGRPGDELYVTGTVGAAAAGRLALGAPARAAPGLAECIARFTRPQARVRCGVVVARSRAATAAIDLSDGLAAAARQLAEASGTGVEIEASRLPIHPAVPEAARGAGRDALELALTGGEDYELLFAVAPRRRRAFLAAASRAGRLPVTSIGRLTREPGYWLQQESSRVPLPVGYQHF
jgi:thiamine-monophosphate kinase